MYNGEPLLNHFNNAEFTSRNAHGASLTLFDIHNGEAVFHTDGLLGAGLDAERTAKATDRAGLFCFSALIPIGAGDDGRCLFGKHLNNPLGAGFGTEAATQAERRIDHGNAAAKGDCPLFTNADAIAIAKTTVRTGATAVIEGCGRTAGGESHIIGKTRARLAVANAQNARLIRGDLLRLDAQNVGNLSGSLASTNGAKGRF